MSGIPDGNRRRVRSLFVSDVHLGCKHSQAEQFLDFVERHQPRYLYVVGDFIDGWSLKRRWRWLPEYDRILKHILALKKSGTEVFYTPGNHDAFLRGFLEHLGALKLVRVCDRFVHVAADDRRFLVTHGDQFDGIENHAQWLSVLASRAYDVLLTVNRWLNRLRCKSHDPYAFCAAIKRRVKGIVKHISAFEQRLVDSARSHRCQGIICGHIHVPRILGMNGLVYCNTGDWVENCSALVEYESGRFELVRYDGTVIDQLEARKRPAQPAKSRATALPLPQADVHVEDGVLVA